MKKKYENPKMQVSLFETEELVTMSGATALDQASKALDEKGISTKYKYTLN